MPASRRRALRRSSNPRQLPLQRCRLRLKLLRQLQLREVAPPPQHRRRRKRNVNLPVLWCLIPLTVAPTSAPAAPVVSARARSFWNLPLRFALRSSRSAFRSCRPAKPTKIRLSTTAPPLPTPSVGPSLLRCTSHRQACPERLAFTS